MARRTYADYKSDVLHSLGNPAEASLDITAGTIVNDALEHLAAMHEWPWLSTGQTFLSVTADQAYVELPADFGTLIAIEHDIAWANRMEPTTWQRMLELRTVVQQSWSSGYWYVIQLGNVEQGQEDAGLSLPTLELYPTPATSTANAIRLVYRRFLRRLEADTDRPQWPSYMDRLLSLLARAFAATDYDENPESAYTGEFRNMINDCKAKAGLARGSFGIPLGAVQEPYVSHPWGYPSNGIPDSVEL